MALVLDSIVFEYSIIPQIVTILSLRRLPDSATWLVTRLNSPWGTLFTFTHQPNLLLFPLVGQKFYHENDFKSIRFERNCKTCKASSNERCTAAKLLTPQDGAGVGFCRPMNAPLWEFISFFHWDKPLLYLALWLSPVSIRNAERLLLSRIIQSKRQLFFTTSVYR